MGNTRRVDEIGLNGLRSRSLVVDELYDMLFKTYLDGLDSCSDGRLEEASISNKVEYYKQVDYITSISVRNTHYNRNILREFEEALL